MSSTIPVNWRFERCHVDRAMTNRRVIEKNLVALETFQRNEVIEVPEYYQRQAHGLDLLDRAGKPLGFHAETPGGLDNIRGFAAISRNTAFHAQGGQRNDTTIVAQHHCQAGRATFHRLQLQYGRCLDAFLQCDFGFFFYCRCGFFIRWLIRHRSIP